MKCTECGASNTAEQAKHGDCAYCGATLPHEARAIEQDAAVRRLLEDQDGDGVPDGLNALAALQAAQQVEIDRRLEAHKRAAALEQLRTRLEHTRAVRVNLAGIASTAALLGLFLSFPYHLIAVRWLDQDPWLGAHHRLFCPLVCSGCRGPYTIFGWHAYSSPNGRSMESTRVYCLPEPDHFEGYSESSFLGGLDSNQRYQLPGSTYLLWLSEIPFLAVLLSPLGFLVSVLVTRKLRASVPQIEAQIRALEDGTDLEASI